MTKRRKPGVSIKPSVIQQNLLRALLRPGVLTPQAVEALEITKMLPFNPSIEDFSNWKRDNGIEFERLMYLIQVDDPETGKSANSIEVQQTEQLPGEVELFTRSGKTIVMAAINRGFSSSQPHASFVFTKGWEIGHRRVPVGRGSMSRRPQAQLGAK